MSGLSLFYPSILAVLLLTVNASLIYETRPSSILLEEFKQEIFNVQKLMSISKIDLGNYFYNDTTGVSNITLSSLEQQLQYLDVNRLSVEFDEDSLVFQGKNGTMTLKYSFVYNNSQGAQNTGNFSLDSVDFLITKNYELVNGTSLKSNADLLNLTFEISDLLYEGDQGISEIVLAALKSMVESNIQKFKDAYESDISSFYSTMFTNKTIVDFKSKDPKLDFTIDMTYDRKPRQFGTYMIFYRMGNINGHDSPHKEPTGFKKDSYQLIISKQVFIDFLNDLSNDGLLDYTVNTKNRPSDLPFHMDIQSLGQVIPSLYDEYSRNDLCEVWSKLTSFKFNEDESSNKGTFTLLSEVYHKATMRKLLTFQSNFLFTLKTAVNTDDLMMNFYIDNSVDIVSVKVLSPVGPTVYVPTLKNWVETTIRSYFIISPYYLLETPLDFSDYFKTISKVSNDQNGLLIFGTPRGMKTIRDEAKKEETPTIVEKYEEKVFNSLEFLK